MKKKNPRWGERIFVRVRKREKEREVSVGGFCGCAKCIFCRNNKVKRVCLSVSVCVFFSLFFSSSSKFFSSFSSKKTLCVVCVFDATREKTKNTHTHTHTHSRRRRRRRRQNSRPHKKPQTRSLSLCVNTKNNNNATSFIDDARRGI